MSVIQVSRQGRATQGVKLIRLDEDDEIAAITKLAKYETEQTNTASEESEGSGEQDNGQVENGSNEGNTPADPE
jgi:DNA gyrase subunit A